MGRISKDKPLPNPAEKPIVSPLLNSSKSRRIKILEAAKVISSTKVKDGEGRISRTFSTCEEKIGLDSFNIIHILGKGSFGEVYLVKYKPIDKPYAMKVLNKKRFISQNLLKYATADRNVLCYTKNPFIVGLDSAFQTVDKLSLTLEYCPG